MHGGDIEFRLDVPDDLSKVRRHGLTVKDEIFVGLALHLILILLHRLNHPHIFGQQGIQRFDQDLAGNFKGRLKEDDIA